MVQTKASSPVKSGKLQKKLGVVLPPPEPAAPLERSTSVPPERSGAKTTHTSTPHPKKYLKPRSLEWDQEGGPGQQGSGQRSSMGSDQGSDRGPTKSPLGVGSSSTSRGTQKVLSGGGASSASKGGSKEGVSKDVLAGGESPAAALSETHAGFRWTAGREQGTPGNGRRSFEQDQSSTLTSRSSRMEQEMDAWVRGF